MRRIVCFGDSITEAPCAGPDGWPQHLQKLLDCHHPGAFLVLNRGRCGETSTDALERINTDVLPELPGIVIIEFGLNDANVRQGLQTPRVSAREYQRNLSEMCRVIRTAGGDVIIILNHTVLDREGLGPQGNHQPYTENVKPYEDAARSAARELGVALIDLPARMRERAIDLAVFLGLDGVHLSTSGYHDYASMIFEGLGLELGVDQF